MSRRGFLALSAGLLAAGVGVTAAARGSSGDPDLAPLRDRVRVGAYVHMLGHPAADPVAPADLQQLEASLGRRLDLVHYFFDWGRPFEEALNENVPSRDLVLSWKPDASVVRSLASGAHDVYVDSFAAAAARYGHPVFLRFAWEMNGRWMDYSAASDGPSAGDYVQAWRHLVTRFRRAGAVNVHFVWCPNERDFPHRPGNRLEDYWPGSSWVDVLGFDAYNWSSQRPRRGDGSWRSFSQLVATPYRRLSALDGSAPIWLCEWGSAEAQSPPDPHRASKAQWFREAADVREYPRLEALLYFSELDSRDTGRDWRLDSSAASLRGFADAFPPGRPSTVGTPVPS